MFRNLYKNQIDQTKPSEELLDKILNGKKRRQIKIAPVASSVAALFVIVCVSYVSLNGVNLKNNEINERPPVSEGAEGLSTAKPEKARSITQDVCRRVDLTEEIAISLAKSVAGEGFDEYLISPDENGGYTVKLYNESGEERIVYVNKDAEAKIVSK